MVVRSPKPLDSLVTVATEDDGMRESRLGGTRNYFVLSNFWGLLDGSVRSLPSTFRPPHHLRTRLTRGGAAAATRRSDKRERERRHVAESSVRMGSA
jgi:hypothetical protein